MNDECLIFRLIGNKYTIGNDTVKAAGNYAYVHNGIKDECVKTIEHINIPRIYTKKIVYRLDYRCFRELNALRSVFIPNTITVRNLKVLFFKKI